MAKTIHETNKQIGKQEAKDQSYTMRGPAYAYSNEEQLYRDIADVYQEMEFRNRGWRNFVTKYQRKLPPKR